MKNTVLLLLISTVFMFSCGKSSDSPSNELPSKAETKPQFDNTNFGVYKGVIVGSSGIIIFRIYNGDNEVKAFLTIDGRKDTLSTTQTITKGERIIDVRFTGSFSSLTLNADNDGQGAQITDIVIDGHPGNVAAIVTHENSTQQIYCYEGKLTGGEPATMNCIWVAPQRTDTSGGMVTFVAKFPSDSLYVGNGYILENKFQSILYNHPGYNGGEILMEGTFGDKRIKGTWDYSGVYGKGNFECERTY